MMNRSLEKYLKKVDENLTAYNLLSGLSYKTADINRDLAILAKKIKADNILTEAVLTGNSYEEITSRFPETAFVSRRGERNDLG